MSKCEQFSLFPENFALSDDGFSGICGEFADAGDIDHRLFAAPRSNEIVRLADKVRRYTRSHGWMAMGEARSRVDSWRSHALAQHCTRANEGRIVLSLFDHTGQWSRPWEEAGYQVVRFDIQDNPETGDVNAFGVNFFSDWFGDFDGLDIYAVLAACPCTEFAISGAKHFAAKDADGRTVAAVELVHQTLRTIEYYRPSVWAIENPVSRIEKLAGLPPWRLAFDPHHFGDPYTKKTLLWGRFNADLPIAPVVAIEGSKMHRKYGGRSVATKNARSETPEGFAYGFFMANNAIDNPVLAVANRYDRLDPQLLRVALDAGICEKGIDALIADAYFFELDDVAAERALRQAINRQ
ncbi:TPA: DNA cytosine methyltransferase [Pseudomonas aeruginosa]|nr:DNA cytosine methyltransferase [Pseudomonas aeruginosa]